MTRDAVVRYRASATVSIVVTFRCLSCCLPFSMTMVLSGAHGATVPGLCKECCIAPLSTSGRWLLDENCCRVRMAAMATMAALPKTLPSFYVQGKLDGRMLLPQPCCLGTARLRHDSLQSVQSIAHPPASPAEAVGALHQAVASDCPS